MSDIRSIRRMVQQLTTSSFAKSIKKIQFSYEFPEIPIPPDGRELHLKGTMLQASPKLIIEFYEPVKQSF